MGAEKFSISTTQELFEALERLREDRDQDRSSLVEMLLREHPMIEREIQRARRRDRPTDRERGRDPEEIEALARSAKRQWEKREEDGEVAFLDR